MTVYLKHDLQSTLSAIQQNPKIIEINMRASTYSTRDSICDNSHVFLILQMYLQMVGVVNSSFPI